LIGYTQQEDRRLGFAQRGFIEKCLRLPLLRMEGGGKELPSANASRSTAPEVPRLLLILLQ